ncbi:hypothetical protein, partial [Actinoplanes philippinensis]|uniref:hypothetical protein n=1 Tax=Actinoplanes philippinensis TaxID=35752 RepID=UPI0033C81AFD
LRDTLALVVGVSSIHDATAFPVDEDGGQALRDYLERTSEEIREDRPELDHDRERLRAALGLPPVDDALLRSLQSAAADIGHQPITAQGERLLPMLSWLYHAEETARPEIPAPPASPPLEGRPDEAIPGQLGLF